MAEQGEHPERVCGPPVVLVAVDHDGRVAADSLAADQLGEAGAVDVVADDGVVEVGVPVDLHGALDVAGLVEQHILVRFDDDEAGRSEVFGEPLGGDEAFGVGVLREAGVGIGWDGHGMPPWDGARNSGRDRSV